MGKVKSITPQQSTIRTLVLSGKYHRYKNWQVKNRCNSVVKGKRWYWADYQEYDNNFSYHRKFRFPKRCKKTIILPF